LWQVAADARMWSCRPSDLLGIDDEYAAYCLDAAAAQLVRTIQQEMEEAGKNVKDQKFAEVIRQNRARKLLGLPQQFRKVKGA
jgi:hypothetical protein